MDANAMKLFVGLFFISLPIAVILTIVIIFNAGSGVAKADALFSVLTVGSLLGMVGGNIVERFAALKRGQGQSTP